MADLFAHLAEGEAEADDDGYPPAPGARATDPATSHAAAARVRASGQRSANVQRVARLVRSQPGSTAVELYDGQADAAGGLARHEVSRRLPDAEAAVLVRRGPARKCRVRGTAMLTWWPI